jgi:hypothetical protein
MTLDPASLFAGIPTSLRRELFDEYNELVTNFYEGRWRPTELQAGRFCEVVYSVIAGRAAGSYPTSATKPSDFVSACRALESQTNLERGLRILASRILPALYEIRNNRDVGHVGGDVDPNFMDSSFAVEAASWLMAELIRVFHSTTTEVAKRAVDELTQLKTPAVWVDEEVRRVLDPSLSLASQCLLLIASAGKTATVFKLAAWTETSNKTYLRKVLKTLHKARKIEAADPDVSIRLLPAGAAEVRKLLES